MTIGVNAKAITSRKLYWSILDQPEECNDIRSKECQRETRMILVNIYIATIELHKNATMPKITKPVAHNHAPITANKLGKFFILRVPQSI